MWQGQHGVAALRLLSPLSLLAPFLPLGLGLRALVRLVGAFWAPGWSLGYDGFGLCGLLSPLAGFGAPSLLARLRAPLVLPTALRAFPWGRWLVQLLHQLLHPVLLRVCTQLGLRLLPGFEQDGRDRAAQARLLLPVALDNPSRNGPPAVLEAAVLRPSVTALSPRAAEGQSQDKEAQSQ